MSSPRPETRFAKQLFLYGNGDGKPVRNVPNLAKLSGVHENTLNKYLPEWEKEAESIMANASEMGLAISLGAKDLQAHKNDMVCLRNLVEAKKFELDRCDEITAKLEGWMDKFETGDQQDALRILEAWQRNAGLRSALESQFMALQKQWTSLSGIVDLRDIEVVRAKEISKGKARLEIKALEADPQARDATPAGFFRRDRAELLEG